MASDFQSSCLSLCSAGIAGMLHAPQHLIKRSVHDLFWQLYNCRNIKVTGYPSTFPTSLSMFVNIWFSQKTKKDKSFGIQ
jgi:hypothetical protein